jgi:hypothetical protein
VFSGLAKAGILRLGSWGTEIHPDLLQQPGDVQVTKHRVSPFYSTTLVAQLSALGVDRNLLLRRVDPGRRAGDCSGRSRPRFRDDRDDDCCCANSAEEHANSIGSLALLVRTVRSDAVDFTSRLNNCTTLHMTCTQIPIGLPVAVARGLERDMKKTNPKRCASAEGRALRRSSNGSGLARPRQVQGRTATRSVAFKLRHG